MKKYLKEAIMFFLTWLFAFGTRLAYIQFGIAEIVLHGNYFQNASDVINGLYKINRFSIDEIYIGLLSGVMFFVGTNVVAVVYLNILMQILTIVLLYMAVRRVFNCYISAIVCVIVTLIPIMFKLLLESTPLHLYILIAMFILCVVSIVTTMILRRRKANRSNDNEISEQEQMSSVMTETNDATFGNCGEMKEITLEDIEKREKSEIQFIENPLPVPKRRAHKEMDYAIAVSDDEDFDLKDMTGLDYFDIE